MFLDTNIGEKINPAIFFDKNLMIFVKKQTMGGCGI